MPNVTKIGVIILFMVAVLSGCMPMASQGMGGVSHGTSPEVCANVRARAAQSPDPATRAYAEEQIAAMGC
jgi:hypothetical protein